MTSVGRRGVWRSGGEEFGSEGFDIGFGDVAAEDVSEIVFEITFGYDSNNRLTNVTDWASRQTSYTYDLAGRVKEILRPGDTKRKITYNDAGETTKIEELDANGNYINFFRLHHDTGGRIDWEFTAPIPVSYTEPAQTVTPNADNQIATFNGQTVVHDDDGNMTSGPLNSPTLVSYTYDARNRLMGVGGVSYTYDPEGNRITLTQSGQKTRFVVSPNAALSQVLVRTRPDGTKTYYVYGLGLLYDVELTSAGAETGTRHVYHCDYRGSTVAISSQSGAVLERIDYSVYGQITRRVGTTVDTPFLFNGKYGVMTDPNGLYCMRARYYNPYLRRFINADPAGLAAGLNFYAYADVNPVSMIDPFGLNGLPPEYSVRPPTPLGTGLDYFLAGTVVGAAGTAGVIAASPVLASGLAASGLVAPATATAAVDTGLLLFGATGLALNFVDTSVNISQGNWNAVAYNAGNLLGGYAVGVSPFAGSTSGGRYMADTLGQLGGRGPSGAPQFSPFDLPGAFKYEWGNRLRLSANDSDLGAWAASAPTPFSGGTAATGIASGIGPTADLVNQYGPAVTGWLGTTSSSSSSPTGK